MNQTAMKPRADRRAFVSRLLSSVPEALVVTGLGSAFYDVFAAGDRDLNSTTSGVQWVVPRRSAWVLHWPSPRVRWW